MKHEIKITGLGGSGANLVYTSLKEKIKISEFIIIDTDKTYFDKLPKFIKKILIGEEIANGKGAKGKSDKGLLSAFSSLTEIKKAITGVDIIFIISGLGGGTASGALQIISSEAKKLNVFVIGIFSKPFEWEGKKEITMPIIP